MTTLDEQKIELLEKELNQKNKYITQIEETNKKLTKKITQLETGGTPTEVDRFKTSNQNLIERNKELNALNKELTQNNKNLQKALIEEQNGCKPSKLKQMEEKKDKFKKDAQDMRRELKIIKKDYEQMMHMNSKKTKNSKKQIGKFPGHDHIIFNKFYKEAKGYENKPYLKKSIDKWIDEIDEELKKEYQLQDSYFNALVSIEQKEQEYPNPKDLQKALTYEETIVLNLNIDKEEIVDMQEILEKQREENVKWRELKKGIEDIEPQPYFVDKDTPALFRLKNIFLDVYTLIRNVRNIYEYDGYIEVPTNDKKNLTGLIARELEKQIGLCQDPISQIPYYNGGEGSMLKFMIPEDEELIYDNIDRIIRQNTTFMQNGKYIDNNFINSKTIYDDIPSHCDQPRSPDETLVGFKNGFYDVKNDKFYPNDPDIPVLPNKNIKVKLKIGEKLNGGYLERIVRECFTPQDQKILLTYIGCCMFDQGYQGRQETLFILGKGGTGKSALVKAISYIFYYPAAQSASKLTTEHKFSYLPFKEGDIVIVDEVQGAGEQFCQAFKEISSGNKIAVEAKGKDVQSLPPGKVAKMIGIGNYLPAEIEENMQDNGVMRRILPIIPQKSMIFAPNEKDLRTDQCLEWLVEEARKAYIDAGLHQHSQAMKILTDEEIYEKVERVVSPESHFIRENYDIFFDEDGRPTEAFLVPVQELSDFLIKIIDEHMLQPVVDLTDPYSLSGQVAKAFGLTKYGLTQKNGNQLFLAGLKPKNNDDVICDL